jgi:cell fate (sporulation/competence/biofilm development) regulator YlbF (YheA/YmcA/DUF963 family)
MSNLEKDTYQLIDQILSSPLVEKYLKAKDFYNKDPYLNKLREEIKQGKKNLPNFSNEELTKEINRIKELEKKVDDNYITITYFNLKNQIEDLIQPIKDLFR